MVKIKLAVLGEDQSYLSRIAAAFEGRYGDKFEFYTFTEPSIALETAKNGKLDVLLAEENIELLKDEIPSRCVFAYLSNAAGITQIKGEPAIFKYQKVDMIQRCVYKLYSENMETEASVQLGNESTCVVAFTSVSGGVGTSTMAIACAGNYAKHGEKVLYLNLEKFGSSQSVFYADEPFGMSDVIFAVKSRKGNLSLKLESCVKRNEIGVYFFPDTNNPLDMLELSRSDVAILISTLRTMAAYDYIVIDMELDLDKESLALFSNIDKIVWIGDGSLTSNIKIKKAYQALKMLEEQGEVNILERISLIYNKYDERSGASVVHLRIHDLGGVPYYEGMDYQQIVEQLTNMNVFRNIVLRVGGTGDI